MRAPRDASHRPNRRGAKAVAPTRAWVASPRWEVAHAPTSTVRRTRGHPARPHRVRTAPSPSPKPLLCGLEAAAVANAPQSLRPLSPVATPLAIREQLCYNVVVEQQFVHLAQARFGEGANRLPLTARPQRARLRPPLAEQRGCCSVLIQRCVALPCRIVSAKTPPRKPADGAPLNLLAEGQPSVRQSRTAALCRCHSPFPATERDEGVTLWQKLHQLSITQPWCAISKSA